MAVVVKMLRILLTSFDPNTSTCTKLICQCQTNFAFNTIINNILCRFHFLKIYFMVAVVVKMLGIVRNSAEPITSTCLKLVCPCQSNFTFKTIKNALLCQIGRAHV